MLGDIHGVGVKDDHVGQLGARISDMPVHSDVATGLAYLKDAGFSIVTLTNSSRSAAPDALDKAGLGPLFDQRFTVDTVRRFKPTPATYQLVQDAMDAEPDVTWMIAAHTWDTIGAQAFGWNAALITRGVNAPLELDGVPLPTLVVPDVSHAAQAIVAQR
jgi:2-haloacid dehalogenase